MRPHTSQGGPAFPGKYQYLYEDDYLIHDHSPGMSLRDWFAGMALQGELASQSVEVGIYDRESSEDDVARAAYKIADAMLAARKEGK